MITNLYAKYLLADRLQKLVERVNGQVDSISLSNGNRYTSDVHLQVSSRDGYSNLDNENITVALLDVAAEVGLPVTLDRTSGLIRLRGEVNDLTFDLYTGTGVCEMVQTGTRVEQHADPDLLAAAIASVPLVDVEVPVFERRCPEPTAEVTR